MILNPHMVTLARELRELTQEQLAELTNVGQAKIAKIEGGLQPDAPDELAGKLAESLKVPVAFLTQPGDLLGVGSSAYFYRKKADLTARDRKRIHAIINLTRMHLAKLLNAVEVKARRPLPQLDIEEYANSAARVAQAVRQFWTLPDGPVKNVTALIESAGVIVVPVEFGTRSMDATSIRLADMPPLIFINGALPGDRWRFTLAHELGHLVMHDFPHEQMEDEADEFAAEFLMPEAEMRAIFTRLNNVRLEDLAKLKLFWRASMAALLKRVGDLGFLTPYGKKSLWISLRRLGLPEPNSFEREETKTYPGITRYFTDTLKYTRQNMEATLLMHSNDLVRLHDLRFPDDPKSSKLRLVS
ncbi:ImmA/IrrE family metallo-endopeptidase [Paraburkholderia sp. MM6662-R1]|uniref:ImmA/IrrE family metallo-endopeptidase n=1 Tax=Paraburkholderia sp. MM6662-R1 TaxID=2991066 RepID=UPI003D1F5FAB